MEQSYLKQFKLSLEESDLLSDSLDSDIHKIYLKILEQFLHNLQQNVIKFNMSDLSQQTLGELGLRQAKLIGAEQLVRQFALLPNELKNKNKK